MESDDLSPEFTPVRSRKKGDKDGRSRSRSPVPTPNPDPNQKKILTPEHSSQPIPEPRAKAYPDDSVGPFVVYFRPIKKALNVTRIAKDLVKFSGVTLIEKVRPNKLRVTVATAKTANDIVRCQLFTMEYRVYIPCRDVEIDGVITEQSLTPEDVLSGEGRFKSSSLNAVKILDCKQLHSASLVGGQKVFHTSDSYRVTFSGSALPDYVVIGMIRLPVRMFIPKVMNCLNCKQLGHTATYCCNKTRCDKCGENHEGPCTSTTVKCVYCNEAPHELSTCPRYLTRKENLKRSIKTRSRRSYAEMLRMSNPRPTTENSFDVLPIDEEEDYDPAEGSSWGARQIGRKRSNISSPKLPRKEPKKAHEEMRHANPSTLKSTPPGFKKFASVQEFPPLPSTSQTPVSHPKSQPAMFSFSSIVGSILDLFNLPESIRSIIDACVVPSVKTFLQSLTLQWPLLAAFISFDD